MEWIQLHNFDITQITKKIEKKNVIISSSSCMKENRLEKKI